MQQIPIISTDALRRKLASGEPVNVIDVRPQHERSEWFIPGSIYADVYDRLKRDDPEVFDDLEMDMSVPLVTVCASGRISLKAAEILARKGYKASSLEHGMKGWSLAWNTAHQVFDDFQVWQIRRTGKGCLSYVVASGGEAVVIDASLPAEVYHELLNQHKLSVKYVIDTHIHADHLSRSKTLAGHYHVPLHLPVPNKVQFTFKPVTQRTNLSFGSVSLQPIFTPGHTEESFSYYIEDAVVFTGDTLFTNGVGRPDLKASEETSKERAALLFDTLQTLISLPDDVLVLPGHTDKPAEFDNTLITTTIGEARRNIALLNLNKNDFVHTLLKNIPPVPPNFLSISEINITGNYDHIDPVELEAGANRCAVS